jgi:hypothetical protein
MGNQAWHRSWHLIKQGRRKSCLGERPWQTKRRSSSAKSEAPGIRGVNRRTLTPKRRDSSIHGGWATAVAVAAAAPDPAAVVVAGAVALDHPAAAATLAAVATEVVVALSAAETRAPSGAAIALAALAAVAEAHLMAAAALVVAVVMEVVVVAAAAAAAAGERHLPAVVMAAQLHQGSRVSRGPGRYPGPRPQRPSDALRRTP